MADFSATGVLQFKATDSGTVLTPTTAFSSGGVTLNVIDTNTDGNIDAVDHFAGNLFTGYTINIGGDEYAIFYQLQADVYFVPFNASNGDLFALDGTAVNQTITNTPNDAVVVNCFVTGTLIDTPQGTRPIETLQIGDDVTLDNGTPAPILWVARQDIRAAAVNLGLPADRLPVRINAGALGQGLPTTDLTLSADHGMILDGLIVNASALVNGDTVRFLQSDEMPRNFSYWHIELESHSVIHANGAPTESFVDYAGRKTFDNYQGYIDIYDIDRIVPELDLPRISSQRLLPDTIKSRLGIGNEKISLDAPLCA